jgi:hypothetical protein
LISFICGAVVYHVFFMKREDKDEASPEPNIETEITEDSPEASDPPVDEERVVARRSPRKTMILRIAAIFVMLFGALVIYELTVYPLLRWQESQSWPEVPCKIEYLGETLRYAYEWEGREYTSGQYDLGQFGGGVRINFQRIKEETPIGTNTVCYVNPDAPSQAVLSHRIRGARYFFGLIVGALFLLLALSLYPRPPEIPRSIHKDQELR